MAKWTAKESTLGLVEADMKDRMLTTNKRDMECTHRPMVDNIAGNIRTAKWKALEFTLGLMEANIGDSTQTINLRDMECLRCPMDLATMETGIKGIRTVMVS